jgi:hypothetical protein
MTVAFRPSSIHFTSMVSSLSTGIISGLLTSRTLRSKSSHANEFWVCPSVAFRLTEMSDPGVLLTSKNRRFLFGDQ